MRLLHHFDAFDSDQTTGDHTPVFLLLLSGPAYVFGQMNSKQVKKKPTACGGQIEEMTEEIRQYRRR